MKGNSVRRPNSPSYITLINKDTNSHCNSREGEIRGYSQNGPYLIEIDFSSGINRLSGELNQEMCDLMSSVSSQIQRATNEAINEQIFPQTQDTLRSGHEQVNERRWEVPARRPGCRSEEVLDRRFRSSSRDGFPRGYNENENLENTLDTL